MSLGYGMVIGHSGWWGAGGPSASSAGKSAVQLLQESKSRYVKSDRVLVSHQEPSRPDRLHISANPNIFLSAPAHTLHPHSHHTPGGGSHVPVTTSAPPPPVPPRTNTVAPLTAVSLALHTSPATCGINLPPPLPSRSPRGPPRPRAKTQPVGDVFPRGSDLRRSLSHGPADRGNDIQMKLRQLLITDSKESLVPKPSTEEQNDEIDTRNGTFRAEVISVCSHKSLPNLNKSYESSENQCEPQRRPSCPGAITVDSVPKPPPRPPRRSLAEYPPKIPIRPPPPRPPPPRISLPSYTPNGLVSPPHKTGKNIGCKSPYSSSECSEADVSSPVEETRRRPILRSKSDVTHERPLGGNRWEDLGDSRRSSYCSNELEEFFNSMGLDNNTRRMLESPPSDGMSPPVYFEERSSEESGHFVRRESDDSDELKTPTAQHIGAHHIGRRLMGEPSIIEKNARVIKWLFKCQKAQSSSIPRSLSSGS